MGDDHCVLEAREKMCFKECHRNVKIVAGKSALRFDLRETMKFRWFWWGFYKRKPCQNVFQS